MYYLELTCFAFEKCQSFEAVLQDFSKPVRHAVEIQIYNKNLSNLTFSVCTTLSVKNPSFYSPAILYDPHTSL